MFYYILLLFILIKYFIYKVFYFQDVVKLWSFLEK